MDDRAGLCPNLIVNGVDDIWCDEPVGHPGVHRGGGYQWSEDTPPEPVSGDPLIDAIVADTGMSREEVEEIAAAVASLKPGSSAVEAVSKLMTPAERALTDADIQALLDQGYRLLKEGDGLRLIPPKRSRVTRADKRPAAFKPRPTQKRRNPQKERAKRKAARRARRRNR